MKTSPAHVLLTTEGFSPRDDLALLAEAKGAKILRHLNPRVHLVRVHVKRQAPRSGAPFFAARATAENEGPDHVTHAEGAEPATAVNQVIAKLERALAGTAGARKHRWHEAAPALALAEIIPFRISESD